MIRQIPSIQLPNYGVGLPGVDEVRRALLWDSVHRAAAATWAGNVQFFTNPIGSLAGLAGAPKTLLDTNMVSAGQIPARNTFEIWDVRIGVTADLIGVADVATVPIALQEYVSDMAYGAAFSLFIDGKTVLDVAPIAILAPGYGITSHGFANNFPVAAPAAGGGAMGAQFGSPNGTSLWGLAPYPLVIKPSQNFQVQLFFPNAITIPAVTASRVWVHFDGVLRKAA